MTIMKNKKRKPTYSLSEIQSMVEQNRCYFTRSAINGYQKLEMLREDAEKVILNLSQKDFVASLPSHERSTEWQDQYSPTVKGAKLYIKLSIRQSNEKTTVVVSFKANEQDEWESL